MQIPAAWHPDPLGRYEYRYWDGQAWTQHVASQGVAGVDPQPIATASPQDAASTTAGSTVATGADTPHWQQPWRADAHGASPASASEAASGPAVADQDSDHWRRPWTVERPPGGAGTSQPDGEVAASTGEAAADDAALAHWQQPWRADAR